MFIALLGVVVTAAAGAGPVESAIIAAMKLPEAPNYSWRTEVVDDARSYEIVGATDRTGDYSLVTMPLVNAVARRGPRGGGASSNIATVVFKGAEQFVVQMDEAGGNRMSLRRSGKVAPAGAAVRRERVARPEWVVRREWGDRGGKAVAAAVVLPAAVRTARRRPTAICKTP